MSLSCFHVIIILKIESLYFLMVYMSKSWNVVAAGELLFFFFSSYLQMSAFLSNYLQAMTLMEYLIKTGSERVAQQCRENIYAVQTLKDFQYIDRDGKDQVNARTHTQPHKAARRVGPISVQGPLGRNASQRCDESAARYP